MRKGNLISCCGGQSLYTWSDEWVGDAEEEEEMAECVGIPASAWCFLAFSHGRPHLDLEKFEHRDFKWAPDGKGMVLLDKDQFCCAFEVQEDEVGT